jgi:hypothetical protein
VNIEKEVEGLKDGIISNGNYGNVGELIERRIIGNNRK